MDNATYLEKYGKLQPMKEGSLAHIFADGVATHQNPLISRSPQEVLTGLWSDNPALLEFQRAFRDEMNDKLKPDLDKNLFSRTGYHKNMDSFCTVSGYGADPISAVPRDNSGYIERLGLLAKYTSEQKEIATEVWDAIFSDYTCSNLNITTKSQSGPRRRTVDHVWKRDYCLYMLQGGNFEKMLSYVVKGDWVGLANHFEIVFLMYLQKRGQVDNIDKVRKVFTLADVQDDWDPAEITADKKVVLHGVEYPDFSAMRMRTVHAGPWALNWFLQIIATGHMHAMFDNFPKTWHVNTEEEIKRVIDGKYIWCGDVSNYDRSMKRDAIDVPHEVAKKYWDERIIDCSAYLYRSAYYSRPLGLQDKRGAFVGNPMDAANEQVFCGNRSGHAWTSLIAKGNKVVETLWLFSKMGYKVKGNVKSWLRGEQPCGVVNNGDDEIVWFVNHSDLVAFRELRSSHPELIYSVEAEAGQVYSGYVLMIDDENPLVYTPVPRLNVTFEKIYIPERSIGGTMRPHWPIGIIQRINDRDKHPLGHIAWEIHNKHYHDKLSPIIGPLIALLDNAMLANPFHYGDATAKDKMVLEDRDKLHYLFKDSEISPHVLDQVSKKLEFAHFESFVSTYYSGTIH